MNPELEAGIRWVQCLYQAPSESVNYLNAESKMVWMQRKDRITDLVRGVLGESFLTDGNFLQKMDRPDKSHAFITVLPPQEKPPVQVGSVTVKGLKIPMIFHKGLWLVDLPYFVEMYQEYM